MLVRVSGYSLPRTFSPDCNACRCNLLGLVVLTSAIQHRRQILHARQRLRMFRSQDFLSQFQRSSVHLLGLAVLSFAWPATDSKLLMLINVDGCSFPSTTSFIPGTFRCISSASLYLPCLPITDAKLFMVASVGGCSLP